MALLLALAWSSVSLGGEEPIFKQLLEDLLPGMGAESIPDRREPQLRFQEVCLQLGAPGRESERAEACRLIAQKLGPETAKPARIWLLQQLEFLGRGECVDAVGAVLDDADEHVRDAARRALQNNPAPEANAPLLARLDGAAGSWRVGLVNSLGARRDPASVPALVKLLGDEDRAAVEAAANALGKIGGPEAARALAAALGGASGQTKVCIADGYLRCADKLLVAGKKDEAAAIYQQLYTPESARVVRLAALKGLLNAAGDKAGEQILKLLQSDDPDQRAIAAGQVETVLGTGALRASEQTFAKLPPPAKVLLLAALSLQGDESAMPVAVAAAGSDDEGVRLAGIRALGTLGDASAVPPLIQAVTSGASGGDAARDSLARLSADGVDTAILEALQQAEPALRTTLIDVLEARKARLAVPALLSEAEHDDAGVRARAVAALGNLASPEHLPDLIKLLLKSPKGHERDEMEKAAALVCSRVPDAEKRADPVLDAMGAADDASRCVLLPLVGRIGGRNALDAVHRVMLQSAAKPEVVEAAIRGLCNWPDATVADELLMNAETSQNEAYRLWTLRAYVRVVTLPSDRPAGRTLEMLKRAMELATRDEERKLILSRAEVARSVETLRWIVPYLDEPSLASEACRTVVELAHHRDLREPNTKEFDPALEKVIRISRDKDLTDRAKRYLEGLP